jgi:hypothetical protein
MHGLETIEDDVVYVKQYANHAIYLCQLGHNGPHAPTFYETQILFISMKEIVSIL